MFFKETFHTAKNLGRIKLIFQVRVSNEFGLVTLKDANRISSEVDDTRYKS